MIGFSCFILFLIVVLGIILIFGGGDSAPIWVLFIFISIGFATWIILNPHYCVIDDNGVAICYICGLKESAEWRGVRRIYEAVDLSPRHIRTKYLYRFIGLSGKKAFFMVGEFPKTKRLEKLLRQYAGKKIVLF